MISRELLDRQASGKSPDPPASSSSFLQARGLVVEYSCAALAPRTAMVALRDVDFHMNRGTITGLAGASGSGKSTLARCLAGLQRPTRGEVLYRGEDVSRWSGAARLEFWRSVQLVPQNVADSLNPRFTAAKAISEPFRVSGFGNARERHGWAMQLLKDVGLPASAAARPTLEFSGGQRQRLVIARALAVHPKVILFDEALSGLDAITQTCMIELLKRLRDAHGLTYLFISHDLGLLARICSEAAILRGGVIVERAGMDHLLTAPSHPYTQELVAAVPPVGFA
jgi:peptide/nickel transport system ATP-binding protein